MRTDRLPGAAAGLLALILLAPHHASAADPRSDPFTPPLLDAQGQPLRTSITSLEPVIVGGVPQWLSIRSHDVWKPVLLIVDDGPGLSQMAWNRRYLADLEQHFIVVSWDQRGAGKSFTGKQADRLTLDQYLSDTIEVARMLGQRFRQEKIYVVGHGFGALVGALAVQKHAGLFHALVAVAPLVNPASADQWAYRRAIELAGEAGNAVLGERLKAQGAPPYSGKDAYAKYQALREAVSSHAAAGYPPNEFRKTNAAAVQEAPEYSVSEKNRLAEAQAETFSAVYPQLSSIDLAAQAPTFAVPVHVVAGRYDHVTPGPLVEAYAEALQAPKKSFTWFEASGHAPMFEEPTAFVELMVLKVLGDAQRQTTD